MAERWPALGVACPCGCEVVASLTKKAPGHARGCRCRLCTNRRNVKSGKRGQERMHRSLGGLGRAPRHEEWANAYTIDVKVEAKYGNQIPASFRRFVLSDWFASALGQAERSISVGMAANPAVYLQPPRGEGRWLVVKLS